MSIWQSGTHTLHAPCTHLLREGAATALCQQHLPSHRGAHTCAGVPGLCPDQLDGVCVCAGGDSGVWALAGLPAR